VQRKNKMKMKEKKKKKRKEKKLGSSFPHPLSISHDPTCPQLTNFKVKKAIQPAAFTQMALPTRAPPGDWGKGKGKRAAPGKRGFHMSARRIRIRLSDGAKRVEIFLFSFAFYLFAPGAVRRVCRGYLEPSG
jgi:hypothetical protein